MKYFGTDGIRGIANVVLTAEIAYKIGRYLGNKAESKIVVGKDSRISGDMLEAALVAGITSAGGDVYTLGIIPTPAVSYLTKKYEADFGVVISASHNPVIDNGIKILNSKGKKLSEEMESDIELFLDSEEDNLPNPSAGKIGRVHERRDGVPEYAAKIAKTLESDLEGMKVVLDCANGAASSVVSHLFSYFKCDTVFIHNEPNGLNINEACGSTNTESLSKAVIEHKADLGIGLDGDADRVICIDENGDAVDGDIIIYLLAAMLKSKHALTNAKVVATVMSNAGLKNALNLLSIDLVTTKVGDKYVAERMEEENLKLGGESSGHIILKEYSDCGDGLLVGLQIMEYLLKTKQNLSHFTKTVKMFPSKLVNINVKEKNYVLNHRLLTDEITRVNNILENEGRVLIRASGTEELVRVLVECESEHKLNELVESFVSLVKEIDQLGE